MAPPRPPVAAAEGVAKPLAEASLPEAALR